MPRLQFWDLSGFRNYLYSCVEAPNVWWDVAFGVPGRKIAWLNVPYYGSNESLVLQCDRLNGVIGEENVPLNDDAPNSNSLGSWLQYDAGCSRPTTGAYCSTARMREMLNEELMGAKIAVTTTSRVLHFDYKTLTFHAWVQKCLPFVSKEASEIVEKRGKLVVELCNSRTKVKVIEY